MIFSKYVIIKMTYKILITLMNIIMSTMEKFIRSLDTIHFSVDELRKIQQSDDPFTNEELNDLLDEELNKPIDEMDTDVVDFLVNEIECIIHR